MDKYENKSVSVDVACVRAIPKGPEADFGLRLLFLMTVDDVASSSGGGVICVVDASKYESMMNRYGTTIQRTGNGLKTKSLPTTLRVLEKTRTYLLRYDQWFKNSG